MHVVLRSSKAIGARSMLRKVFSSKIETIIRKFAAKNHVIVRNYANVGNHIHLLVQAKTRAGFKSFLRTITAQIATLVTGAKKGLSFGKFWDHPAFSRIIEWGRHYLNAQHYLTKNNFEGEGVVFEMVQVNQIQGKKQPKYRRFIIRDYHWCIIDL